MAQQRRALSPAFKEALGKKTISWKWYAERGIIVYSVQGELQQENPSTRGKENEASLRSSFISS